MKYKFIIYIFLILPFCICTHRVEAQYTNTNPLLEVVGKPYAEYHEAYMSAVGNLLHVDSLSRVELVRLFDEAAATDKSGEWDLLSGIVRCIVHFYESRKSGYTWSAEYTAEDFSGDILALSARAEEKGFPLVRLFALYQAAEGYGIFARNYEQSFACYLAIASELETITTKEFPPRPHIYNQIARMYYTFREYDNAITYYRKVVEDPDTRENYYGSAYPAMNGLGLSYRNGFKDYERSDSCFMQILQETESNEQIRNIWEGIAKGNIGFNYYQRGDFDTALSWLIPSIEKITRPNDFTFVSQRAVDVAYIYIEKGELSQAKKYIDIALDRHQKTNVPEKGSRMYEVLSRYYAFAGDKNAAVAYLDSTIMARDKENEVFSGLVLHRVEQQLRAADNKLHKQQLDAEQTKSRMYLQAVLLIAIVLVVILALLGLILILYRRKRNAYRELVRQNQNWAGVKTSKEPIHSDEVAEQIKTSAHPKADEQIMENIENAMSQQKLYKQPDLTLDILAEYIGHNRYYISAILNRCTGKNLNSYINEYRIKEAIRIMSDSANDGLTIDAIAYESGFNDRVSFYRVFKKVTGLSPSDFRKNIKTV